MEFQRTPNPDGVTLAIGGKTGLLRRLTGAGRRDLDSLSAQDRRLAFALADLRALAADMEEALEISDQRIRLSHRLVAALDARTAAQLGLPPLTDLTLRTDVEGLIGDPGFRLRAEWWRGGQRKTPRRIGAILATDRGEQRLPLWLFDALEVAQAPHEADDAAQWEALARFRRALDPGVAEGRDAASARISMTDFLSGLQVSLADGFSISPNERGDDFEVLPFSRERLESDAAPLEADSELRDDVLVDFQRKLRQRGALNAFRLGPGRFMVVDRSAAPALQVMAQMQRAAPAERAAFIRNPRRRISEAVEAAMDRAGAFADLDDAGREEAIERAAGPLLVETEEFARFSARVTGVGLYQAPDLPIEGVSPTTWLPEIFTREARLKLEAMPGDDLAHLAASLEQAIGSGAESVDESGLRLPARKDVLEVVRAEISRRDAAPETPPEPAPDAAPPAPDAPTSGGPAILQTRDNFHDVQWRPALKARAQGVSAEVPSAIVTPLKPHQHDSLRWQAEAWSAGLPGILNADEQGLGKTLQTIAFLVWLNERMETGETARGPVLVVAPTSLLENWEQEVARHVAAPGLGRLIRLYGSGIAQRRKAGAKGMDTAEGAALLDFADLVDAADAGRGHRTWVLTTYATLTNYQHSLAQIPFAAAVFDEIQALKTPGSLRAFAARAMKAEFRIGLTGTPIENATADLWAIMDQLAPGSLGSLKAFAKAFGTPEEDNMRRLHARVFGSDGLPPLALRRLKKDVARDLPAKTRSLLPLEMPPLQADLYDDARAKLETGRKGAFLKMLHHIRTVSVHPDLTSEAEDRAFIALSARLRAAFRILEEIRARDERALVFIEHRQMQYRFIELAKAAFGLRNVDLINGETPIRQRQAIVNRFQKHLESDGGFDLLVLGPRAAGTGLTLTAATHVIHLSRWWNPAVEEQCNDRVHRIGQTAPVHVHVPMAIHPDYRDQSFDCLLHSLMQRKRRLAGSALWPMGDTKEDAAFLADRLGADAGRADRGDPVEDAIAGMFRRDGVPPPPRGADGGYLFE
ncbi:MAG: hypothetical protein CML46_00910 [Rhodobacteraceae bacterium]|nr:hypothetical protein [Paracoccaceae bacterium]MBR25504.1 hypothetical protein [Paracoccaceae bacterium]